MIILATLADLEAEKAHFSPPFALVRRRPCPSQDIRHSSTQRQVSQMAPEFSGDVVRIEQIEVLAHIGVPDQERSQAQRLTISVIFLPNRRASELNDDIEKAVDYAEVCQQVRSFVQTRRDRLIETQADALAQHLLGAFAIREVTIELRKYILPDVEFVSVTVRRERLT